MSKDDCARLEGNYLQKTPAIGRKHRCDLCCEICIRFPGGVAGIEDAEGLISNFQRIADELARISIPVPSCYAPEFFRVRMMVYGCGPD
jgi:hypothetical protein